MSLKNVLVLFVMMLTITSINAQKNFMKEADVDYKNESYFEASQKYIKSAAKLKKAKDKGKAYFYAGECYRHMLNHEEAQKHYQKAIDLGYDNIDPIVFKNFAEMMRQQGDYKDAITQFSKYIAIRPADQQAKLWKESCDKALEWIESPTRYIVENESQLNTDYYDFSPAFYDSKNTSLVFSSSRPASTGSEVDPRTGETFMDLFSTERDNNDNWAEPTPLPAVINTDDNEGASTLNAKADELYFTRCPRVKKENAGCDILYAKRQGSNWQAPESLLKKEGQDSLNHGHPALTPDGKSIVFASDMPGGKGGKDLWMITYDKRAKEWSKPVNLGSKINTSGNDMFPFIKRDGTLYFSSDGHLGMGGLDLYSAEALELKVWGNVQNLGYPVNSSADDFSVIFERSKEDKGFFTSNRAGGKGQDDIYSFRLPPIEFSLECVVKNKTTLEPVPGAKLKLIGSDGSLVELTTDGSGKVLFEEVSGKRYLLKETNYTLEASKDEFLKDESKLTTVGYTESKKFYQEFFIQPATKDVVIDFPEVRYAYNKAELQIIEGGINSKDSLDYLFHTLVMNPNIIVELQSHTDCRGSDSYNKRLSQKRAQSCVDYLVAKGIPKERMTAKGLGEEAPRYDYTGCDDVNKLKKSNKDEFERLHQLNRRTQFRVLTFDYKPLNNYGVDESKITDTEVFIKSWKGVK